MKPKTMILMGLAIACGLGAAIMTSKLIARGGGDVETVNILVAKKDIPVGEHLKKPEDLFVLKAYSVKDVPDNAMKETDIEQLKGKSMKRGLRKGDHMTATEVYGDKDQIEIPPGHQSVGLRVNVESSASGHNTLPRSKVDVILVVKVNNNDIDKSYVQVLLQDVLVLAADTKTDREGITLPAQVVTLALTPEDAKRVSGAKAMGEMSLALRPPGDNSRVEKTVMTFREIKDGGDKGIPSHILPALPEVTPPAAIVPTPPAQEAKKDETKVVPFEETPQPKITTKGLQIQNGGSTRTVPFRYNEDGSLIEDYGTDAPAQPAAPNKKNGPTDA